LDRLACDKKLRRICGWEQKGGIPSESTFSRAFAEFSESQLPACVHQAMISENLSEDIVGHISRDATEIEVREKPQKETKAEAEAETGASEEGGRIGKRANEAGAPADHDVRGNAEGFASSV
jgi:hypothetical protein